MLGSDLNNISGQENGGINSDQGPELVLGNHSHRRASWTSVVLLLIKLQSREAVIERACGLSHLIRNLVIVSWFSLL